MVTKGQWRQYFAAFSCYLCCSMCGVGFVWFTPIMMEALQGKLGYDISYGNLSWLIAIIEIGELITPIPAGHYANRIGRKTWLQSTFFMVILSWVLAAFTRSVAVLFCVRMLQGFAIGIILTIGPIYNAEISEPKIRGQLCGHLQTMWYIGILYAYCTGPFLSYQNYIYVSSIPGFVFMLFFYFIPESPYYLLISGQEEKAENALKWFRANDYVKEELNEVKGLVSKEMSSSDNGWYELIATSKDRKALLVLLSGCYIKYFGGTSTVINFCTKTLTESMDVSIRPEYVTIALGVVLVVTTSISAAVTDCIGRKPLIVMSSVLLGILSVVIAVYYYLEREVQLDLEGYQWVLYCCLVGYCIAASLGLGPALFAVQAENFSANARGAAGAIATCLSTSLVFISLKQYQLVEESIGVFANYLIYAGACFSGLIVIVAYMKETAILSLSQIRNEEGCKISRI